MHFLLAKPEKKIFGTCQLSKSLVQNFKCSSMLLDLLRRTELGHVKSIHGQSDSITLNLIQLKKEKRKEITIKGTPIIRFS